MPIYYSSDEKAWSLKDVTEEEIKLLLELGKQAMLQLIGVGILKRMQEQFEKTANMEEILQQVPKENMGQA